MENWVGKCCYLFCHSATVSITFTSPNFQSSWIWSWRCTLPRCTAAVVTPQLCGILAAKV